MKLSVEHRCIETAAKAAHRRIQSRLFQLNQSLSQFRENAQLLELLEDFLRETDFSKLRVDHPELAGGHPRQVTLKRSEHAKKIEVVIDMLP